MVMLNTKYQPMFVQVTPLVAWAIVIIAYSITGMLFVAGEPIVTGLFGALYSQLPDQSIPIADTLRLLFYALPIAIDLLLSLWAFLVTTRRQPVTRPIRF
jgi:hypothetical protein